VQVSLAKRQKMIASGKKKKNSKLAKRLRHNNKKILAKAP
jgi:hypothetical protein